MVYKKLTPNLIVEDVNSTVTFYRDILRFELINSVPVMSGTENGKLSWVLMKRDHVEIMFQSRESSIKEIPLMEHKEAGGSLTLYIEMEHVSDLYETLQDKVVLVEELHSKPYGMREFSIQDCNGFILTFAEEAEGSVEES